MPLLRAAGQCRRKAGNRGNKLAIILRSKSVESGMCQENTSKITSKLRQ
uniref:Uncharacterized protein n=1 Tax=Romanomermis culicivorax TaxID=13658 RepID=A0A915JP99_ROMCU